MRLIDMKESGGHAWTAPRARPCLDTLMGAVHASADAGAVFAPRKTTSRTTCATSDEAMVYAPKHVLGGGERRPGRPGLGGDDGLGARAAQAPPTPRASCVAVLPRPFSMPLEPGRSRSGRCASPTSPRSLGRAPLPLTGRGGCSRPGGWRRRSLPPVALATDFIRPIPPPPHYAPPAPMCLFLRARERAGRGRGAGP